MDLLKKIGGVVYLYILVTVPTYASVKVSEVMPCNISTYMDMEFYDFPGWIELHNTGDEVSLKGYTISHCKRKKGGSLEFKNKWVVEEDVRLDSGAYKLLFFDSIDEFSQSEKENNPDGYEINQNKLKKYVPFKLDSDGGSITLYNGGTKIDSFVYLPLESHISYGRSGDKSGYMNPTPGKSNGGAYSDRVSKLTFDGAVPGVVEGDVAIRIKCETEGVEIFYTEDGSEPTTKSEPYSGEFIIGDGDTKVIRARAFLGDQPASEILTGTFMYLDSRHEQCGGYTVPIVSISTDINYFEDDEIGIAVKGSNGVKTTAGCLTEVGITKANFLQDWRRPVVFEYIKDGVSVMSHEMEAAIIGGCSRKNSVQSLKFKAGSKVGSTKKYLEINPFEDRPGNTYSSLHLRNGGNAYDAANVRVRDGYMQALSKPMNLDYQAYQPVAYYLNGEYKGLMGLRERTNKDYVEANYGLEESDIDHMEMANSYGVEATTGTLDWYNQLVDYLENNDPKSEMYYETACRYMDMDEYLDFQIFEHFIVNTDWPGNNAKIWRDRKNGKLRWIIYDTDFGLGIYESWSPNYCAPDINFIEWASGTGSNVNWANGSKNASGEYEFDENSKWKVTIFAHLIQNPEFRERFIDKTLIHLGTTFTNERVQAVWDSLKNVVEDEYCAFTNGGTALGDMSGVSKMLNFAKERPGHMYEYTAEYFGLGDYVNLEYSSNVAGTKFLMNKEFVNFSSYGGRYIANRPLTLEAIAPSGYKFSHWEIKDNSSYIDLMGDMTTWKYFYQSESPESAWKTADFDDSEWMEGVGKMGYRVSDTESNVGYNTILDFGEDPSNKYLRAYFRSTFEISDKSKLKELLVNMVYDDGYIFYLNGKEIRRQKVAEDLAEGEEIANPHSNDDLDEFTISMDDVINGTNVVAIMVCQNTLTSSDMTLQLSMQAEKNAEEGVMKDERKVFATNLAADIQLHAVFEEYSCDDMFNDYSVLVLNEVAPSNDSSTEIIDEYGVHSDWFEIYNSGDDTLNLAGLYLSDDETNLGKSLIPFTHPDSTLIAPKGFVRFWADNATYRGVLHSDFKLSNTDPTGLYLSVKCGETLKTIDEFRYKNLPQNASAGHFEEGSDLIIFDNSVYKEDNEYLYTLCVTPGAPNTLCQDVKTLVDDKPVAETELQIYPNPAETELNIRATSDKILFVQIFDAMGRNLFEQKVESCETQIDMNRFATGTYYLQIVTNKEVLQKKVIKL